MKPIDLGMSYEESMPVSPKEDRKKHYPTFTYEGDEEMELPEEGKMTIHFCKVASTESERNGKKHYSCTVEVKHILDVDAGDYEDDAPTKKYNGAEDALDRLMEKKMKEKNDSY